MMAAVVANRGSSLEEDSVSEDGIYYKELIIKDFTGKG
jgi:hypothetical protein